MNFIEKIAKKTSGLSSAHLNILVNEITLLAIKEDKPIDENMINKVIKLLKKNKNEKLNKENPKFKIIEPEDIEGSINDLIGMKEIKEELLQLKDIFNNKEMYKNNGYDNLFNIIFSGPAGTGKTKIASYLAKELDIPLIYGTANLGNQYVNSGSDELKKLFSIANEISEENETSVIVFLDESESLLKSRKQNNSTVGDEERIKMVNELLSQLDGVNTKKSEYNVIFISASNFDDGNMSMDEAMARRFNKKIYFRLPNKEERKDLLEYFFKNIENKEEIDYKYISDITSGISPASLELIKKECVLESIRLNVSINTELVVKKFKEINIGRTDKNTNTEKTRKIVALHELGHFIISLEKQLSLQNISIDEIDDNIENIENEISTMEISTESISKIGALGFVLNKETDDDKLKSKSDLEWEIKKLYGGVCSEKVFFGEESLGCYNDIQKITQIMEQLVYELGFYTSRKINLNQMKHISNNMKEEAANAINDNLIRLENETFNIINKHKEIILYLNDYLLENYTLSIKEALSLISSFFKNKNI